MSETDYINSMFGVKDKVALITGGRRGLGLDLAKFLVNQRGQKVRLHVKAGTAMNGDASGNAQKTALLAKWLNLYLKTIRRWGNLFRHRRLLKMPTGTP